MADDLWCPKCGKIILNKTLDVMACAAGHKFVRQGPRLVPYVEPAQTAPKPIKVKAKSKPAETEGGEA
jgi:hypothetical protein